MTLPAFRYYTADDLSWFSLDRYAALADFSFAQWHELVQDRLHAQHVVESCLDQDSDLLPERLRERWGRSQEELSENNAEALNALATRIKTKPLDNLGVHTMFTDVARPIATSTVKLMTGRYVQDLYQRTEQVDMLHSAMEIDGALPGQQQADDRARPLPPTVAHLVVDLAATDKQVIADFKRWLAEWHTKVGDRFKNKSYDSAKQDWCEHMVVSYFDLKLLGKIDRKVIKDGDLKARLFPNRNETWRSKALNNLPRWQEDLFSDRTEAMLAHLSFSDARSQLQEKST